MSDDLDADACDVARTIALRSLEHAPRTRKQLADLLAKRNVPIDAATIVLDRLVEVGLIDDADFARRWVDERHRHRGLSRRVLQRELLGKGVADEHIAVALAQISTDDEFTAARELAMHRIIRLRDQDETTQRRRLGSFLQRRGYSYSVVSVVVEDAVESVRPDWHLPTGG